MRQCAPKVRASSPKGGQAGRGPRGLNAYISISSSPVIIMRISVFLIALCLAVGCSTPSEQQNDDSEESSEERAEALGADEEAEEESSEEAAGDAEPAAPRAPMWSEEGLETQERMKEMEGPEGAEPGSTPWQESDYEVPQNLGSADAEGAPTPGALLVQLVAEIDMSAGLGTEVWEQTVRVLQEDGDEAVGVVMQWGLKDDSVAGMDLRANMKRGERAWYIDTLEQRVHCRRGVTDDGLCL